MPLSNPAHISAEVIASLSDTLRAQIPYYHQSLQPNLYAGATICFVAAWIAVGLRFYSRRLKGQRFGWDDYTILLALGFYVPFYTSSLIAIAWGTGRHSVVLVIEHPGRLESDTKAGVATLILYPFPLYFTKISTLLLYNRIFGGASPTFTRICMALGVFITGTHIYALVVFLTACIPLAAYWSVVPGGHCMTTNVPYIVGSSLSATSDALVLLLPMPQIWRMRTSYMRKIQISFVFLLGSSVLGVAVVKAVLAADFPTSNTDISWTAYIPHLLANLENGCAAVAACLPVLRPVFNKCVYGSVEAPLRSRAPRHTQGFGVGKTGAAAAGGRETWRVTIGGRKILVGSDGLWPGWADTTVGWENETLLTALESCHTRGDSRVSNHV